MALSGQQETIKLKATVGLADAMILLVLPFSLFLGKTSQYHLGQPCSLLSEARNLSWKRKRGIRARKGKSQDVRISRSPGYHHESARIHHLKRIDAGFVKATRPSWRLQLDCKETLKRAG